MTQETRGYLTHKEVRSAQRWAQKQLDTITPILRRGIASICAGTNNAADMRAYFQLKNYAEQCLGVVEGWLSINESSLFADWAAAC